MNKHTTTINVPGGVVRVREYGPGETPWRKIKALQNRDHRHYAILTSNSPGRFHGGEPRNGLTHRANQREYQRLMQLRALIQRGKR